MTDTTPYLVMNIEAKNCKFYVKLNDMTVIRHSRPTPVDQELPVNYMAKSGENTITMLVWNEDGQKQPHAQASCSATLELRDIHNWNKPGIQLGSLAFNQALNLTGSGFEASSPEGTFNSTDQMKQDKHGDVVVSGIDLVSGKAKANRSITVPLNLPRWKFFDSDTLEQPPADVSDAAYARYVRELLPLYQRVQDAIVANDFESVMPLFSERNQEMDIALGNPPGTLEGRLADAVKETGKANTEALELNPEYLGLQFQANRKLVRLRRNKNVSAISINYLDGSGSEGYDIWLRRENGQWIISR